MKKSPSHLLLLGVSSILAVSLSGCGKSASADGPQYAQVTSVKPVSHSTSTPHQVCHDEVVTQTQPSGDSRNLAGTALGAVAGGAVGHLFGSGHGRAITTIAGAVGGGYVGNRVENSRHQGNTNQRVVRRCSSENQSSSQVVGYNVTYTYKGVSHTSLMKNNPGVGNQIRVQQGVSVVGE